MSDASDKFQAMLDSCTQETDDSWKPNDCDEFTCSKELFDQYSWEEA